MQNLMEKNIKDINVNYNNVKAKTTAPNEFAEKVIFHLTK